MDILKYPRTPHIQGSRHQAGDEDLESVPFDVIAGRPVVVEEKMDGANSGIRFDDDGSLLLQSRGRFLTGGRRERHFHLFKQWAGTHADCLRSVLGSRFLAYGEWLYAKHTVFYDLLPHYWLEFDVFDRQEGQFLDTPRRAALLEGLPIVPVRVLFSGTLESQKELTRLVGRSHFISDRHWDRLTQICQERRTSVERVFKETDPSADMEGLYLKVEEDGVVKERYKFVRASFLAAAEESEGHWLNRPLVPNQLREAIDLFSDTR